MGNKQIETIDEYKRNNIHQNRFVYTHKIVYREQANTASLQKINTLDLPYDLLIGLFDETTCPILFYGSEIYGIRNNEFNLNFTKTCSSLKMATISYMI